MKIRTRQTIVAYTYLGPAILLIGGLIFYPLIYSVWLSFTKVPLTPGESPVFVRLSNYASLLNSSDFRYSFLSSFVFTSTTVFGSIILGLGVALVMHESFRGRFLVRGISLLPYFAPIISVALIWKFMLHPILGIFNYLFVDVIAIFSQPIPWATGPAYALQAVIVFDIWRYFPFAYLFILAGLQRIPDTYYDAAKVDGASAWQCFKFITLSELRYILAVLFLIRWIWNFNKFTDIYLFTSTVEVMPVYLFREGFQAFNLGMAACVAVILLLLQLAFVIPFIRLVLRP